LKKGLVAVAAFVAVLAFTSAAIADPGGPTLSGIGIYASDGGGWDTYPTSACGEFHLFVAENGDPVNGPLEETIDDQLADGTTTFGLIGTDGNGAGTTQRGDLVIDGTTLTVPNHGSASGTFDGKLVTASLSWSNKSDGGLPYVDRVAVCGQFADGYQDIAARRGKKIATTAVARKLLTRAWHLLTDAGPAAPQPAPAPETQRR